MFFGIAHAPPTTKKTRAAAAAELHNFCCLDGIAALLGIWTAIICTERRRRVNAADAARVTHGLLKLRTVHFGDITIIYESKVSEQNIFPWLKGTIESRPHTKFQINCSFK
jgi:hypothetical protein